MPFDEIHVDLKKQTLYSSNFSLLKLGINSTKGYGWRRPPSVAGERLHDLCSATEELSVELRFDCLPGAVLLLPPPRPPSSPYCVKTRKTSFVFTRPFSLSSF